MIHRNQPLTSATSTSTTASTTTHNGHSTNDDNDVNAELASRYSRSPLKTRVHDAPSFPSPDVVLNRGRPIQHKALLWSLSSVFVLALAAMVVEYSRRPSLPFLLPYGALTYSERSSFSSMESSSSSSTTTSSAPSRLDDERDFIFGNNDIDNVGDDDDDDDEEDFDDDDDDERVSDDSGSKGEGVGRSNGTEKKDTAKALASTTKGRNNSKTACLSADGPQPYVLMTLGRSGSGSTWQIIGNLTGYETPSVELTGKSFLRSRDFFHRVERFGGSWITSYLCQMQRRYPKAGVVGFKWKPYATLDTVPARGALRIAAASVSASSVVPTIKFVRSRRNLLDVILSQHKHRTGGNLVKAHCLQGDEACLEAARKAGTGLALPAANLVKELRRWMKREDATDALLDELGVPVVRVSYEALYTRKDPGEWMKIFRFLGVGPQDGLTWLDVERAMGHVSTSNSFHNVTIKNYEEVRDVLRGSEFEGLLHR